MKFSDYLEKRRKRSERLKYIAAWAVVLIFVVLALVEITGRGPIKVVLPNDLWTITLGGNVK